MPSNALLILADDLTHRRLAESNLPHVTAHLATLNESTLHDLISLAETAGRGQPRRGWAIMAVAAAAANHTSSLFQQALAAWHLGRLTNEFARPQQALSILTHARRLFTELNEPGWVAACLWQENSIPWFSSNLPQSLSHLQKALIDLENAGETLAPFVFPCRLALATFQLIQGDLATAQNNIAACELAFRIHQDNYNLGRCLLIKAIISRRNKQIDAAITYLDEATALATDWPGEKAKAGLQRGYLQWINQGNYLAAIDTFTEAMQTFTTLDMPVWGAQAQDGLAQVYTNTGNLRQAEELLQKALHQATVYETTSLRISILLDMGWYLAQRGNPERALVYLQLAVQLAEQARHPMIYAIVLMHLGDAYIQSGRYQLALRYLEKSHDQFKGLDATSRLAECELRLARTWLSLGQANMAHHYLDQAGEHARQANHLTIWPYVYYRRANTYIHQKQMADVLAALEEGVQVAQQQNDPNSTALMQRALGEMYLSLGKPAEAFSYLTEATASFQAMGMAIEKKICQIHWGSYFQQTGNTHQARLTWEQVLNWSQEIMPDIAWQAAAGLALLAQTRGNNHMALKHYHQVREALRQLRQGFWQPELMSSFNLQPAATLDQAIHLAVRVGTSQDVLAFIEENKARLNNRQIQNRSAQSTTTPSTALQTALYEIRWLQEQLRMKPEANRRWQNTPLKKQLKEQIKAYETSRSRWQREQQGDPGVPLDKSFDQNAFRQKANEVLGTDWIALDYYLTEEQIQGVVITPTGSHTWAKKRIDRDNLAIKDMVYDGWQATETEATSPLRILGQFLIPELVVPLLTPRTMLIIAPHRQLHDIPWAALQLDDKPLVALCIPTLTLSLSNLMSLWSRPQTHTSPLASGLLLALSTFPDHRTPLPEVTQEVAVVRPHLSAESVALTEEAATWDNFLMLGQDQGFARFSFWHVASHAFHEPITGRLSGISFYDRDVWLDELWQCAPLPQLVTLSACSGSKSKLYEGDEHISLATTCLAAGAQTVVGSLWPVPDKEMPWLMRNFYAALAQGKPVALALALAQRQAWEQGHSWRLWGGLTCTGVPL